MIHSNLKKRIPKWSDKTYLRDMLLLSIMAVGAGCGMIYEYLPDAIRSFMLINF